MNTSATPKIVMYEITPGAQPGMDFYGPDCSVFSKGDFVEVKKGTEVLHIYSKARVIKAGVFGMTLNDLVKQAQQAALAPANAPAPTEAVHPANGTEGREDSPNR